MTLEEQNGPESADEQLTTLTQNELVPANGQEAQPAGASGAEASATDDPEALVAYQNLRKDRAAKKRKKRIRIGIIAALLGGILAIVLSRTLFASPDDEEMELAPQTTVVERTEFSNIISASGALKAGTTVMVTPEVDGIIEDIRVSEGQDVNKGDVLFKLRNDDLDKAIREAGQEVASAEQGVGSAQREVDEAVAARDEAWAKYQEEWDEADEAYQEWREIKDNYDELHKAWKKAMKKAEKYKCAEPVNPGEEPAPDNPSHDDWQKLYEKYLDDVEAWENYQALLAEAGEEPQPAGEEPQYPEAPDDVSLVSTIDSAQEGVESAAQALQKANEAYEEAVANAEKRTVTAPSSGSVVEMTAKVGQAIGGASSSYEESSSSSSSESLVQISNMNVMAVDIEVNEIDILSVKKGQWAKVTFSALPDIELDAQVAEVATVASGSGGGSEGGIVTFHVGLVIPNPDPRLRPGMTASVNIYTVDIDDALVIPATALVEEDGKTYVELVTSEDDEGNVETEQREVTVGERSSTDVVIESGLEEGDTILLTAGMGDLDLSGIMGEEDEEW